MTFAEFASATAEEHGDARQEMQADLRLLDVEAEAAKSWWRRMFRRGRGARAGSDPNWEVGPGTTDKGGGARGRRPEYAVRTEGTIVPAVLVTRW